MQYVVYLTTYFGNKLPMFYIGSTSIENIIKRNYIGSVKSKEYKDIFRTERNNNRHLFKVKIIKFFNNRNEALECELRLQTKLNVVKSSMYINKSLAKNFGWFGMNTGGENSPVYGKRWKLSEEAIRNVTSMQKRVWANEEYRKMMSDKRKGRFFRKPNIQKMYKDRKESILQLYKIKPVVEHGYVCKNGKVMSYDQAFSKKYAKQFGITQQAIKAMINNERNNSIK